MSNAPFTDPPARRGGTSTTARRRMIAVVSLGLVIIVGLFLLFSGSSEKVAAPPATVTDSQSVKYADGTLTVVENDRLVLKPFDGAAEMTFVITDADRDNFDIAHIQSHSSVALPTRIYYEREGGRLLARYKEDAPVNSQQDGS